MILAYGPAFFQAVNSPVPFPYSEVLTAVSLILSIVALFVTIIGFFASLKFYREGMALQQAATRVQTQIEEKLGAIGQQVSGMFDKTLDAAIHKGGQISEDFDDIKTQIEHVRTELLKRAQADLTAIGVEEREKLEHFIANQFKSITDQVAVTQENAAEMVGAPEDQVIVISRFQRDILAVLRDSREPQSLETISEKLTVSPSVVASTIARLVERRLVIQFENKFSLNLEKLKQDIKTVYRAFRETAGFGRRGILLSQLGSAIQRFDPSFNVRVYGYANLSQFLRDQTKCVLDDNFVNGINHYIVRNPEGYWAENG